MYNVEELTIEKFHNDLKSGTTTCKEVMQAYIDRINLYDKQNDKINAIILINPNAIKEAEECDKKIAEDKSIIDKLPLFGCPLLVKDNFETYDMPTTAGSKTLEGFETHKDAFVVDKLRKAGAVIVAKTNLHEFAVWGENVSSILGQTHNPYDHSRSSGGSSGGTGAGLAANFGLIGIGTDTINSVRSPSSANSLCGIRPTIGLVSRMGIVPYSLTQDTAGALARTLTDAVKTFNEMIGSDPEDNVTVDGAKNSKGDYTKFLQEDGLKGKKLGILRSFMGNEDVHKEVNKCMENCFKVLKDNGAELVDITEQFDIGHLVSDISLHLWDFKYELEKYLKEHNCKYQTFDQLISCGLCTPDIIPNLEDANKIDINSPAYKERAEKRLQLIKDVKALFDKYGIDAIIYPHQQQLVCKVGKTQAQRNGAIGSVTGFPAIVVPGGFSTPDEFAPIGVPVGMEILGKPFTEGTLLEIAYGFEQHSHFRKVPKLGNKN